MTDVNQTLPELSPEDSSIVEQLLPLVYDELRRLASHKLAAEQPGQTLDATGLVHEVFIRLYGSDSFSDAQDQRGHFLASAAQGMRHILIDRARRKNAHKRGGGWNRQDLKWSEMAAPMPGNELIALNEALGELAELDTTKARLVELRFFVGLTGDEAAQVLGISSAKADRDWSYARAWLQTKVRDG